MGLLVLSRYRDEEVYIDIPAHLMADGVACRIRVMMVEVQGYKARLGFEAPKGFSIHRHEVWEAIQRENSLPKVSVSP